MCAKLLYLLVTTFPSMMNAKLCSHKGLVLSMVNCSMMHCVGADETVIMNKPTLSWSSLSWGKCPSMCVCAVIEDKRQFPAAERGRWLPRNVESALAGKLHSSSALWLSCEFDINTTCNLKSGKYGKSLCKAKNVACESRPLFLVEVEGWKGELF